MPWYEAFDRAISSTLPDLEVLPEEPMARHTTFRLGGPARRLARPKTEAELVALLELCQREGWPYLLIGNGSNLLVSDGGLDRPVIETTALRAITAGEGDCEIRAQAGSSLASAAVFAQRRGLEGLAFAHGIPGTVGGGACMNAGAYGGEMAQVLTGIKAWLPGRGVVTLRSEDLALSYRHSFFSDHPGVALEAVFTLRPGEAEAIRREMEDLLRRRKEKQPLEYPSAGSTFKRPAGHYAGALIDQCGLRGTRVGGAQVSEKHAGFVINTGDATCADVLALIDLVRQTVLRETGVELEPEVKIVLE